MGEWINRDHKSEHQKILESLVGHIQTPEISDRIPEVRLAATCDSFVTDRRSWENGTLARVPMGTSCYTDGSKLGGRTGLGLFIEEPEVELYFRLPNHNTVFQAEVRAITECVNWLSNTTKPKYANIFTDSQMAIKAITSERVKSRTVLDCKKTINDYSAHGQLRIFWVPGHSGVMGNERANSLASKGRDLQVINLENSKPFDATKEELKHWAVMTHKSVWNSGIVGETTKILWGDPNEKKTSSLLKLSKIEISKMMSVLTGHSSLQAHLYRIGVSENDECRACRENIETMEHFLCQCPAFTHARSRYFGSDILPDLTHLRGYDWKIIRKFVSSTEFL